MTFDYPRQGEQWPVPALPHGQLHPDRVAAVARERQRDRGRIEQAPQHGVAQDQRIAAREGRVVGFEVGDAGRLDGHGRKHHAGVAQFLGKCHLGRLPGCIERGACIGPLRQALLQPVAHAPIERILLPTISGAFAMLFSMLRPRFEWPSYWMTSMSGSSAAWNMFRPFIGAT